MRFIRITDLAVELPPVEALEAANMALVELALAQALAIIHGVDRGLARYIEAGGHVRFDDDGEPGLLWAS